MFDGGEEGGRKEMGVVVGSEWDMGGNTGVGGRLRCILIVD